MANDKIQELIEKWEQRKKFYEDAKGSFQEIGFQVSSIGAEALIVVVDKVLADLRSLPSTKSRENDAVELYTKDQLLGAMGWCAAMDNTRPIHELKEETEWYIENKLTPYNQTKTDNR